MAKKQKTSLQKRPLDSAGITLSKASIEAELANIAGRKIQVVQLSAYLNAQEQIFTGFLQQLDGVKGAAPLTPDALAKLKAGK